MTAAAGGLRRRGRDRPGADVSEAEVAALREQVDQLQHALDSRVLIEQAKGMLAERHDEPVDVAFERLRDHARCARRRVVDVAEDVIEGRLRL